MNSKPIRTNPEQQTNLQKLSPCQLEDVRDELEWEQLEEISGGIDFTRYSLNILRSEQELVVSVNQQSLGSALSRIIGFHRNWGDPNPQPNLK